MVSRQGEVAPEDGTEPPQAVPGYAGIPSIVPRPTVDLAPLLAWLRSGQPAPRRLDFPAGTALPDGRLDLCKQQLGPEGALLVAEALPRSASPSPASSPSPAPARVRHLLLGTDGLGDEGAAAVAQRAAESGVQTLYLGCNGITAAGACTIADRLHASPQVVNALWLKRNPLGSAGGRAAADLVRAVAELRTLDLVQTGLDPAGLQVLVDAVLDAGFGSGSEGGDGSGSGSDSDSDSGRVFASLYLGGNPLGPDGAAQVARLLAAGAVEELYLSACGLGDAGASALAEALIAAPYGRLRRLSAASSGIGPDAAARLVGAAAGAGVELLDLGRVRSAGALGAASNRLDTAATTAIAEVLAGIPHRLQHLVLADTGMRSREALPLLAGAQRAVSPTRYVLGKGIATSVRRRLDALSADVPELRPSAAVAAIRSVHRTPPPEGPSA